MTNPDDPAFPKLPLNQGDQGISYPGLTKREWFAGMAMQGLLARPNPSSHVVINGQEVNIDRGAVLVADALIAELNKPKP